jgi:hypothetical protein
MKRVLLFVALGCAFASPVPAAAAPVQTGIAFDQVTTYYTKESAFPAPAEFDTVFARVQADRAQHAGANRFELDTKYGQVFHVAISGDLERLDIPGNPVYRIYNQKAKWIKIVDTQKHTYVRETMPAPQVFSVDEGKSIVPSPRPSPWPDAEAKLGIENAAMAAQTAGGLTLTGARSTLIARIDTPTCRPIQLRTEFWTYATPAFTEPAADNLYERPFSGPGNLTSDAQCVVPDFTKQAAALLPTYPNFVVFSAQEVMVERTDGSPKPSWFHDIYQVTIRGHVRPLTNNALFETPSGYKWDPSLAD